MAPPKRAPCQVCDSTPSKYTCADCAVLYCSVPCYKQHKETCRPGTARPAQTPTPSNPAPVRDDGDISTVQLHPSAGIQTADSAGTPELSEIPERPLRTLASLRWPYVPDESAYPDPLKRDDPKPLQLPQYEAIATSPVIRRVLGSNPRLRDILKSIDEHRGDEREGALQEALGVSGSRSRRLASLGHASEEDKKTLRQLAEAIEGAVRGGKQDALGLDWGD